MNIHEFMNDEILLLIGERAQPDPVEAEKREQHQQTEIAAAAKFVSLICRVLGIAVAEVEAQ